MTEDLFAATLSRFKNNESPEAVLLVAGHPDRIKIAVAWMNLKVERTDRVTAIVGEPEEEAWAWLWANTRYSRTDLMGRVGIPFSEAALERKLRLLIGNRILYPDGTVNSYVQRYLRQQVLRLFEPKAAKRRPPA